MNKLGKSSNKNLNSINIINNNDIKIIIENNKNNDRDIKKNDKINNAKKINLFNTHQNPKHSYIISKEKHSYQKDKDKDNKNCVIFSNYANSVLVTENNIQKKPLTTLKRFHIQTPKNHIENIKVDKFLFNKKYYKQLSYLENLINKELFFQKIFIDQKSANSKMFLKGYQTELDNMGIVAREEVLNSFLILNDKVTSKERNYEKEMKLELEFKNKPRVFANMFKSVSQKMKEGKQIRSAVGKVLDKY